MEENERRNYESELQTELEVIPKIKTEDFSGNEDFSKPLEGVRIGGLQHLCVTKMEENERRNYESELQTELEVIPKIKTEDFSGNEDFSKPLEGVGIGGLQHLCVTKMNENETRNDECQLQTESVMKTMIKTEVLSDSEDYLDTSKSSEKVEIGDLQNLCVFEMKEELREEVLEINDIPLTNGSYIKEECLSEDEELDVNMTNMETDDPLAAKCMAQDLEVSHGVFIKEESEHQLENNTFGSHFMTFMESKDQCSSGQLAVEEESYFQHPLEKAADSSSYKPLVDEDGLIIYKPLRWIDGAPRPRPKFKKITSKKGDYKKKRRLTLCACKCGDINHKSIQCEYCPYTSKTYSTMKFHTSRKHNVELLDCPYCKYRDLSLQNLQDHIDKKHHVPLPICTWYSCPHCDSKFKSSDTCEAHIAKKHTHEVKFKCGFCDFKCWSIYDMKKHYKIH